MFLYQSSFWFGDILTNIKLFVGFFAISTQGTNNSYTYKLEISQEDLNVAWFSVKFQFFQNNLTVYLWQEDAPVVSAVYLLTPADDWHQTAADSNRQHMDAQNGRISPQNTLTACWNKTPLTHPEKKHQLSTSYESVLDITQLNERCIESTLSANKTARKRLIQIHFCLIARKKITSLTMTCLMGISDNMNNNPENIYVQINNFNIEHFSLVLLHRLRCVCCNRADEWVSFLCGYEAPRGRQHTARAHRLLWICFEYISSYVTI